MPPPGALPIGTVVDNKYEVRAILGTGGFGEVYRVLHRMLDEELALKTLRVGLLRDPGIRERFFREARILKKLLHANIVPMRDVGEWDGHLYLTMDLCPGETLSALLKRRGRLSAGEAAHLTIQVLRALEHAHGLRIVHRDLKPANLMLVPAAGGRLEVKVLDFGVAKVLRDGPAASAEESSLTEPGANPGTLRYMSPEQVSGEAVDARSDLYALGTVLYEALTGRRPFDGTNGREIATGIMLRPPPPFAQWQVTDADLPGLEALTLRALTKDPAGRPQTARDFRKELEALLAAARRPRTPRGSLSIAGLTLAGKNSAGLEEYRHDQTGIVLVLLPAGEFQMGSPAGESERREEEQQHLVRISRPFLLAKCAVTQAQWQAVMQGNPSHFRAAGTNAPVETVSWEECREFCRKTGLALPTEAQWEYACRAGTTTPFHFGTTITTDRVNYAGIFHPYGGASRGPYRKTTVAAGSFPPNAWGLHDMHGNVYEWCEDAYDAGYYARSPAVDPLYDSGPSFRVLRGGSWCDSADCCRSAHRGKYGPESHVNNVGFRPARPLP
ncbi:MAG: SUMF1/EgtB/PvdO family nonheme iron enzyme [Planctomycetes bacterium]|nr:SUMF1/EgtB/PvdO family nonheme iron enzyme [Planctomycetota bacterium]